MGSFSNKNTVISFLDARDTKSNPIHNENEERKTIYNLNLFIIVCARYAVDCKRISMLTKGSHEIERRSRSRRRGAKRARKQRLRDKKGRDLRGFYLLKS